MINRFKATSGDQSVGYYYALLASNFLVADLQMPAWTLFTYIK
jgi:hypothetical protein